MKQGQTQLQHESEKLSKELVKYTRFFWCVLMSFCKTSPSKIDYNVHHANNHSLL